MNLWLRSMPADWTNGDNLTNDESEEIEQDPQDILNQAQV